MEAPRVAVAFGIAKCVEQPAVDSGVERLPEHIESQGVEIWNVAPIPRCLAFAMARSIADGAASTPVTANPRDARKSASAGAASDIDDVARDHTAVREADDRRLGSPDVPRCIAIPIRPLEPHHAHHNRVRRFWQAGHLPLRGCPEPESSFQEQSSRFGEADRGPQQ